MANDLQVGAKLVSLAPRPLSPGAEARAKAHESPMREEDDNHMLSVPDGNWVLQKSLEKVVDAKHQALLGIVESMFTDMLGLEERILRKTDISLTAMRQEIEQTIEEAVIPMVRNIGMAQADLKDELESKIDAVDIAQKEMKDEMSEMISEIQREVSQLGLESFESRADLMARIDDMGRELSSEALESRSDLIAELDEVSQKIDSIINDKAVHDLESLEAQLEQDLAARAEMEIDAARQDDAALLQSEVRALGQRQPIAKEESMEANSNEAPAVKEQQKIAPSACDLDLTEQTPSKAAQEQKRPDWLTCPDWSLGEASFSSKGMCAGAPYSSKTSMTAPLCYPFDKLAPPAASFRAHRPRPSARMANSHSMPLLAPLH